MRKFKPESKNLLELQRKLEDFREVVEDKVGDLATSPMLLKALEHLSKEEKKVKVALQNAEKLQKECQKSFKKVMNSVQKELVHIKKTAKATTKKAATRKTTGKKAATKKTATRKTTAKKVATKKTATRKTTAKKAATKKAATRKRK